MFDEALKIQGKAEALLIGNEHEVVSRCVLELIRDSKCSTVDYDFIALAVRLGATVLTMDGKILRAFPHYAMPLSRA